MAKKASRLENAIDGLDDVKKKQVMAEIRHIRIQSVIAILTVVGAAISFVVLQQNKIKEFFTTNPTVMVVSGERIVNEKGQLEIYDIKNKLVVSGALKNTVKKIELAPGSYKIVLKLESVKRWEEQFVLENNEARSVKIPDLMKGNIKVFVSNGTPRAMPGQFIDIAVNSTGNGYLWIYQRVDSNNVKLLFPKDDNMPGNEVSADKQFEFSEGTGLKAGEVAGEEQYILLVTSVNEDAYASEIIRLIFKGDIVKGEFTHLDKNWGLTTFKVMVQSPE